MSVRWVLGGLQHLSAYSGGLAILRNSVSMWLWPNTQENKLKEGRCILVLGVRELNPWLQEDCVADEPLQFKGEGRDLDQVNLWELCPWCPSYNHAPSSKHFLHPQLTHTLPKKGNMLPARDQVNVEHEPMGNNWKWNVPGMFMVSLGYADTTRLFCLVCFC
jgi:hypothetical protein